MCKAMKYFTSSSSNSTGASIDYIYVEYPEVVKNVYVINPFKHSSPCDNCPNNPAVNRFATGVCNCTLNLPAIY